MTRGISEAAFMQQVFSLCRMFGWAVYHPTLSKWSERGWPDLSMVRGARLIFAELKSETGKTTVHQDRWLDLLGETAAEVYLWRPSDIDHIAEVLR